MSLLCVIKSYKSHSRHSIQLKPGLKDCLDAKYGIGKYDGLIGSWTATYPYLVNKVKHRYAKVMAVNHDEIKEKQFVFNWIDEEIIK